MAKETKKRGKLDLSTATVADGAQKPIRSVYELVGIKDIKYRETTYGSYQGRLKKMNLIELQDHGFSIGVVPASSRDIMIDRLERKYLQENPDAREQYHAERTAAQVAAGDDDKLTVRQRAERVMEKAR